MWWEDRDLDGLTGAERRWGPFLFYLADADPDWRETGIAWLLRADGGPMSCKDVATAGQEKGNRVARLLGKLELLGVLIRRDDGAFGFRNYRKHQEDPSAERQRRRRAGCDIGVTVTHPTAGLSREKQKAEAEGRSREGEVPPTPPLSDGRQERAEALAASGRLGPAVTPPSAALLNPLDANHNPDAVRLRGTTPPAGCRQWGLRDTAEIYRQIQTHGVEHVEAVVAFVYDAIEKRRRFGENESHPKQWSALWKYDGDAWDRWDQRFAEQAEADARAKEREQQTELEIGAEEKKQHVSVPRDIWANARGRK